VLKTRTYTKHEKLTF